MRKALWIILAVIAALIAALIAAIVLSGTPEHFSAPLETPAATAKPTPSPTPTPVPTPAPTPVEHAGVLLEQAGEVTYYFQNYALKIPEAWRDRFDYETAEDSVSFYSKQCRKDGYDGVLCWIAPTMVMSEEEIESFYHGKVLGEQDGCYYILTEPIGEQYDPEDEAAAAVYEEMRAAIEQLVEGFGFTDGEPEAE